MSEIVYYLPGWSGRLNTGLGQGLMDRGFDVSGRETRDEFRNLPFLDQAEQRQLYLKGLIEKIEAKFNRKTRAHELDIHFRHPIVGDGIKYKDPKNKPLGYKVLNGSKTTQIRVEKRDGRGK